MFQDLRLFCQKKRESRLKTVQLSLCFSFYYQQRERFPFSNLNGILRTLHYVIYSRLTPFGSSIVLYVYIYILIKLITLR